MNPRSANLRRALPPLAIAVAMGAGALAARAIAARHPARLHVDFAQPFPIATGWGGYGGLCFAAFACAFAGAVAAWCATLRMWARDGAPRTPAIVAFAAAIVAASLAWPFGFSSDAYAYAAYGALANARIDPYAPLAANVHGAIVDAARFQWGGAFPVCVYGPAFVGLARLAVAFGGGDDPRSALIALRGIAALAFLASIALLDRLLATAPAARRARALGVYALNPLVAWSVAEGHNDALVVAAVFAGLAIARGGRGFVGAALVGLAPVVKATGLAFAIALALEAATRSGRTGRARTLAGLAGGLALAAALTLPPLLPALGAERGSARYAPVASAAALVVPLAAAFLAAAVALVGLARVLAHRRDGYAIGAIGVVLALPNPYPWYAVWLVPFALLGGAGRWSRALVWVTIFSAVRYLPDAVGTMTPGELRITASVALSPLALAAALALFRLEKKALT